MKSSFFLTALSLVFVLASFALVNADEEDEFIPDVPEDATLIDYQNYIYGLENAVKDIANDMMRQANKEGVDINSETFKKPLYEKTREYFVHIDKALDKAILLKNVPDNTYEKLVDQKYDSIRILGNINNEDERTVLIKMKAFVELLRKNDKTKYADYVEFNRIKYIFGVYFDNGNVQEFEKAAVKIDQKIKNAENNITPDLAKVAVIVALYGIQLPDYRASKERADYYYKALSNASDQKVKDLASYMDRRILSIEGKKMAKEIVGQKIELTGMFLDGSEFNVKNYPGKIVLLDIWATWLGTEIGHLRKVKDLYNAYHDKGLEVIGIVWDKPEDYEKINNFLEENGFTWKQVYESSAAIPGYICRDGKPLTITKYLAIEAIPYSIIVGTDGKVIAVNLRHSELVDQIHKIFDERE